MSTELPPEITQLLEEIERDNGFDITRVPTGTMFEIDTRNGSTYMIVVTEPQKREIVLLGPHKRMRRPTIYYVRGATMPGSAVIKSGWIIRGRSMCFGGPGSIVTTSPVKAFRLLNDPERVLELVAEAESRRLPKPTEDDRKNFEQVIKKMVDELQIEHRARAKLFIQQFNPQGQAMMIRIMLLANKQGRLEEALNMLDWQFESHWAYRAPEIRGSFISEVDVQYIELAYRQLKLPLPDHDNDDDSI
jgi:hypothetical protein